MTNEEKVGVVNVKLEKPKVRKKNEANKMMNDEGAIGVLSRVKSK